MSGVDEQMAGEMTTREKRDYVQKEHPVAKWVNATLNRYFKKDSCFLTDCEMWYPERLKPRQPKDLEAFIKSAKMPEKQIAIMGLKRDGWFLEIRISETDTVQYFTYEGKEYDLQGLLDVELLRSKLPVALQMEKIIIHAEFFIMEPGHGVEAGCDVVGQALRRWGKYKYGEFRKWIRVSAFRLQCLGYLSGARLMNFSHELALLQTVLDEQPNVAVMPWVGMIFDTDLKLQAVSNMSNESERRVAGVLAELVQGGYIRKGGQQTMREVYEQSLRFANERGYEGLVLTLKPKGSTFNERFKKDFSDKSRSQYQIKCKSFFEGVYRVDRSTHALLDNMGRNCGVIPELHREKGLFEAIGDGDGIRIKAVWIALQVDQLTGEKKYTMTGVKYVRIEDIVRNPSEYTDIEKLCTASPRWLSVQAESKKFKDRAGITEEWYKGKKPRFVEGWIRLVTNKPLPSPMMHPSYPKDAQECMDWEVFKAHVRTNEEGVILQLPKIPSVDVLIKRTNGGVQMFHREVQVGATVFGVQTAKIRAFTVQHSHGVEFDLETLKTQLKIATALSPVNAMLENLEFSFVARAFLDVQGSYTQQEVYRTLLSKNSYHTPRLRLCAYRLLKISHVTGTDLAAATQMQVLEHLLQNQPQIQVAKFTPFKMSSGGVHIEKVDMFTEGMQTIIPRIRKWADLWDTLVNETNDSRREFMIRRDPPLQFDEKPEMGENTDEGDAEEAREPPSVVQKRKAILEEIFNGQRNLLELSTYTSYIQPEKESVRRQEGTAHHPEAAQIYHNATNAAKEAIKGMSVDELRELLMKREPGQGGSGGVDPPAKPSGAPNVHRGTGPSHARLKFKNPQPNQPEESQPPKRQKPDEDHPPPNEGDQPPPNEEDQPAPNDEEYDSAPLDARVYASCVSMLHERIKVLEKRLLISPP